MPQLKPTKRLIFANLFRRTKKFYEHTVAIFVSNISYKRHFWSYSSIIKFKYLNNLVVNILVSKIMEVKWELLSTLVKLIYDFKWSSIFYNFFNCHYFLQINTNFINLNWLAAKDAGWRCHLIRIYFGTHCKLSK